MKKPECLIQYINTGWWAIQCTSNLCEIHHEQNTPTLHSKTEERALGTTHTKCNPLVCTDDLCVKHEFGPFALFLDPHATRSNVSDRLVQLTLAFNAHGKAKFDPKIERENLHRHAHAALFRPSRRRRVQP
jgi:hypothetical protein